MIGMRLNEGRSGLRQVSGRALGVMSALLLLLVSCSDGVTEPEEVPRVAAELRIVEPAAAVVKDSGEPLVLGATGRDGLGQPFSSESFVWSSDLQGTLGQGETVTVTTLGSGTHWVVVQVDAGVDGLLRDSVDVVIQPPAEHFERDITPEEVDTGFVFGQIMIRYSSEEPSAEVIAELNREYGFSGQRMVAPDVYMATIQLSDPGAETEPLVQDISGHPEVAAAALNLISSSPLLPEVLPAVASPYASEIPNHFWEVAVDGLWAQLAGSGHEEFGSGSRIAVIDTGVDLNNPAFTHVNWVSPRYAPSANVSEDERSRVADNDGHGTMVTSVLVARADSLLGVAPHADVIPIKLCRDYPLIGCQWTLEHVTRALDWARTAEAQIVNVSFGSRPSDRNEAAAEVLDGAFARLAAAGALAVVAAGNVPTGETWDGVNSYGQVAARHGHMVVGASDETSGTVWQQSPDGPEVDVLAPGTSITVAEVGGGTRTTNGTSFSAPLVAGLAALHLQSGASPGALRETLRDWTVEFGAPGTTSAVGRVIGGLFLSNIWVDDVDASSLPAGEEVHLTLFGRNLSPPVRLLANGQEISYSRRIGVTTVEARFQVPSSGVVAFEVQHPAGLSFVYEMPVREIVQFSLTVEKVGAGTVTSSPPGIEISESGDSDTAQFEEGTTVTLTATPAEGWQVESWSGACSGSAVTCIVTMSQDREVGVSFDRDATALVGRWRLVEVDGQSLPIPSRVYSTEDPGCEIFDTLEEWVISADGAFYSTRRHDRFGGHTCASHGSYGEDRFYGHWTPGFFFEHYTHTHAQYHNGQLLGQRYYDPPVISGRHRYFFSGGDLWTRPMFTNDRPLYRWVRVDGQ